MLEEAKKAETKRETKRGAKGPGARSRHVFSAKRSAWLRLNQHQAATVRAPLIAPPLALQEVGEGLAGHFGEREFRPRRDEHERAKIAFKIPPTNPPTNSENLHRSNASSTRGQRKTLGKTGLW